MKYLSEHAVDDLFGNRELGWQLNIYGTYIVLYISAVLRSHFLVIG